LKWQDKEKLMDAECAAADGCPQREEEECDDNAHDDTESFPLKKMHDFSEKKPEKSFMNKCLLYGFWSISLLLLFYIAVVYTVVIIKGAQGASVDPIIHDTTILGPITQPRDVRNQKKLADMAALAKMIANVEEIKVIENTVTKRIDEIVLTFVSDERGEETVHLIPEYNTDGTEMDVAVKLDIKGYVDTCKFSGYLTQASPLRMNKEPLLAYGMHPALKGEEPQHKKGVFGYSYPRILAQEPCSSTPTGMDIEVSHSPGGYGLCMGWDHVCEDGGMRGSAILSGERSAMTSSHFSAIVSGNENGIEKGSHNTILGGHGNTIHGGKHITLLGGKNRNIIGGKNTDHTTFTEHLSAHGSFSTPERILQWKDGKYVNIEGGPVNVSSSPSDYLIIVDIEQPAPCPLDDNEGAGYDDDEHYHGSPVLTLHRGKPGQHLIIKSVRHSEPSEDGMISHGREARFPTIDDYLDVSDSTFEYYPPLTIKCPLSTNEHSFIRTLVYDAAYDMAMSTCALAEDGECTVDLGTVPGWMFYNQCFSATTMNDNFLDIMMVHQIVELTIDLPYTIWNKEDEYPEQTRSITVLVHVQTESIVVDVGGSMWFIWSSYLQRWVNMY